MAAMAAPAAPADGHRDQNGDENTQEPEDNTTLPASLLAKRDNRILLPELVSKLRHKQSNRAKWHDFCTYLAFLILFIGVFLWARANTIQNAFILGEALRSGLIEDEIINSDKTFRDIGTFEEMWTWIETVLVDIITNTENYNGDTLADTELGILNLNNRIVGAVRLRQMRVRNDSCSIQSQYDSFENVCVTEYSKSKRDTAPFGPGITDSTADGFIWTGGHSEFFGTLITVYDRGGYVVDLNPKNKTDTLAKVDFLRQNRWLDTQTRAVNTEMTVYNANIDMFCVMQMLIEFAETGTTESTVRFRGLRLDPYFTTSEKVAAPFEIIFFIFVFYYLWEEAIELFRFEWRKKTEGETTEKSEASQEAEKTKKRWHLPFKFWINWEYFLSAWNLLELLNLSLFIVYFARTLVFLTNDTRKRVDAEIIESTEYVDLQGLADFVYLTLDLTAFNVLLSFIKAFKHLQISDDLSILWRVLSLALFDLCIFLMMFGIVFLAFAGMGHTLFGYAVEQYRDFLTSCTTLFRVLLGDFDYASIQAVNYWGAPIFFISFEVIVFFILVNMFLAIMNDAYEDVKQSKAEKEDKKSLAKAFGRLRARLAHYYDKAVRSIKKEEQKLSVGTKKVPKEEIELLEMAKASKRDFWSLRELSWSFGNLERAYSLMAKFGEPDPGPDPGLAPYDVPPPLGIGAEEGEEEEEERVRTGWSDRQASSLADDVMQPVEQANGALLQRIEELERHIVEWGLLQWRGEEQRLWHQGGEIDQ